MKRAGALAAATFLVFGCDASPQAQTTLNSEVQQAASNVVESMPAQAPENDAEVEEVTRSDTSSAAKARSKQSVGSCSAEIGQAAAETLVATCREVSPATRPHCNVVNSCAIIRNEITRGRAFVARTDAKAGRTNTAVAESAQAAVDVVRRYYAAISGRDFGAAYRLWGNGGQASGTSRTAFSRGFSHTSSAEVTIGDVGTTEGGAGSIYLTVPVTVDSRLEDGTRQRFTGTYVLRRVTVPSASAAARHWHIDSAKLTQVE